ncbi:MAG: hypothetical protein AB1486_26675 [Planctomycetota bacterium]
METRGQTAPRGRQTLQDDDSAPPAVRRAYSRAPSKSPREGRRSTAQPTRSDEARFGPLSCDIARRIDEAPIELLQRWVRSFPTAKTLGDVFTE